MDSLSGKGALRTVLRKYSAGCVDSTLLYQDVWCQTKQTWMDNRQFFNTNSVPCSQDLCQTINPASMVQYEITQTDRQTDRQKHRQTDRTDDITSSANTGGAGWALCLWYIDYIRLCRHESYLVASLSHFPVSLVPYFSWILFPFMCPCYQWYVHKSVLPQVQALWTISIHTAWPQRIVSISFIVSALTRVVRKQRRTAISPGL